MPKFDAEETLDNIAKRIEFFTHKSKAIDQLLRRHVTGEKGWHGISKLSMRVEPPLRIDKAVLYKESVIQACSRIRYELPELGEVEFFADRELQGLIKHIGRIMIKAKDEVTHDGNSRIMEAMNNFGVAYF